MITAKISETTSRTDCIVVEVGDGKDYEELHISKDNTDIQDINQYVCDINNLEKISFSDEECSSCGSFVYALDYIEHLGYCSKCR